MTALAWIRNAAKQFDRYELTVEGETIVATSFSFNGNIPTRMVMQLRKQLSDLVQSDMEHEVVALGGQYRGDFNKCSYTRTVYERAA